MFRYLTKLVDEVSSSFKGILYMNSPLRCKKFCFFYNPHSIRKQLLYTLGKKRYIDEFLLPRKQIFILQSILMFSYAFQINFLKNYFDSIKTKTKIVYVKDLLTLAEYNHLLFFRKYLTFSINTFHTNIVITDNGARRFLNKYSWFFIGDMLEVDTITDKYFLFFNIFFFISPILYNKKHILLYNIYNKTHMFLNKTIKRSFFCLNEFPKQYKTTFPLLNNISIFFINSIFSEKTKLKLLTVILFKYFLYSTKLLQYSQHISLVHVPVFFNMFFLGKCYNNVSLFQYKTSVIAKFVSTKRSRKRMRFLKRKSFFSKKIIRSITNLFSYKANIRKKYYQKYMGSSLNKTFTKKVHSNYFYKKFGFLNKKSNLNNMFFNFLY